MKFKKELEEILIGFNFTYGINEGKNTELATEIKEATLDQIISLIKKEVIGEDEEWEGIEPRYDGPHPYAKERNQLRQEQREKLE